MLKYVFFSFFLPLLLLLGQCRADSTVIVTCASGELGGAIARLLAEENNLILTGRDMLKLRELQTELNALHTKKYEICKLDYATADSIELFKKTIQEQSIAGLVLITPRIAHGANILQEPSDWQELFQMAFTGPLEALKATLPQLIKNSKIVILSGISSVQVMPAFGPSCVLRRMWTTSAKVLSHQIGPQGIRVNVVSPDIVFTPYHQNRITRNASKHHVTFEEELENEVAAIPLRRHGQQHEVANAVKFLLSDASSFISGVNLVLDGGSSTSY